MVLARSSEVFCGSGRLRSRFNVSPKSVRSLPEVLRPSKKLQLLEKRTRDGKANRRSYVELARCM